MRSMESLGGNTNEIMIVEILLSVYREQETLADEKINVERALCTV